MATDITNGISSADLKAMSKSFNGKRVNQIAANASIRSGVAEAAADFKAINDLPFTFSVDLKQGKITDQQNSGRCWIFAAMNTFRYEIMKKYNLETFELSQSYIFFYDKLEKANFFLNNAIKTVDEPVDGRLYAFLATDPICDGGQWDMIANIVSKYGVVPSYVYPDSKNASSSTWINEYLTSLLREDAAKLRRMANGSKKTSSAKALNSARLEMMNEVYRMLCIALGEPPAKFDLTLTDKDDKVTQEFGITPLKFFEKYVGLDLQSRVSLINAPSNDKPLNKTFTVKFLGNVEDGNPVKYLNLSMEEIKAAVVAQLKDGHPVWFGSDCMKFSLRKEGVFDRKAAGFEKLFDIQYEFNKGDRLTWYDSAMNHAMVILGVNLDKNGAPDRWRIENSWGKDAGVDGYYVASDSWFDEFVYQVVVDKKYLPAKTVKLLDKEPIALEPWDPMGTLAD
ncbi:MAG: C1 family peptidase [Clostridiales bacterium]|nr:C1 family peptidase [Clostridiales bacterium]